MAQFLVKKQFFPRHTKPDDSGWIRFAVSRSILFSHAARGVLGERKGEETKRHPDNRFFARLTRFDDAPWIRFAQQQSVLFAAAARYELDEFRVPNLKNRWRIDGDWMQETPWVQPQLVPFWSVAARYQLDEFRTAEQKKKWRADGEWIQETAFVQSILVTAFDPALWPSIEMLARSERGRAVLRTVFQLLGFAPDAWMATNLPAAAAGDIYVPVLRRRRR